MILLNKTMMCGGLVVLSPGSPSQVVCAILIMQFHMLLVLKTAPYIKDSEDWSSFFASLGLTLTYTGALVQMLRTQRRRDEFDPEELSYANVAMAALPVICVSTVIGIMIFVDGGLWNFLRRKKTGEAASKDQGVFTREDAAQRSEEAAKELELTRRKFDASSKEYKEKLKNVKNWNSQTTSESTSGLRNNVNHCSTKVLPLSSSATTNTTSGFSEDGDGTLLVDVDSVTEKTSSGSITNMKKPKEIFEQFDIDNDGSLKRDEVKAALLEFGCVLDDKNFEKTFSDSDKNSDGSLSFKEFKKTV